jgi:signal peptidase I
MAPSLLPGDRLLVARPGRLRTGDIVAFPDPREPTRLLVKRVWTVTDAGVDVRGDNAGASTDSRTFGLVAREAVIGRAVYRYEPRRRAGALARHRP